jgi:hypothetical protein
MRRPPIGLLPLLALVPAILAATGGGRSLVPTRVGDRFGFETWTGRTVIQPHFDMVTPFRDGRAAALRNGAWGFLDEQGRWVGKPRYDWVHPDRFDEGPALVSAGGLYGYVDRDGTEVVPLSLPAATPFVDGHACATDPDTLRWGLLDATGRNLTGYRLDGCDPRFRDGRARVRVGEHLGYVDRTGELVLEPRYDRAEPFSEGLAWVEEAGLGAFIDPEGRRIIPATVARAGQVSEGRVWLEYGPDQVGFVDTQGRPVGPRTFRAARGFHGGVAWVQDAESGRWGLLGRDGAFVVPPTYEDPGPFVDGLARVARDGRYGLIDTSGAVVLPLRYATVGAPREGRVAVRLEPGGLQGVVDLRGRTIAEPRYDEVSPYHDGVARVSRCRAVQSHPLAPAEPLCEVFFLDHQGRERRGR